MDLIVHVSSIALLILLVPHAKQDPKYFGFALYGVGLNIAGKYLEYLEAIGLGRGKMIIPY